VHGYRGFLARLLEGWEYVHLAAREMGRNFLYKGKGPTIKYAKKAKALPAYENALTPKTFKKERSSVRNPL